MGDGLDARLIPAYPGGGAHHAALACVARRLGCLGALPTRAAELL
jgi:hypothetical protein